MPGAVVSTSMQRPDLGSHTVAASLGLSLATPFRVMKRACRQQPEYSNACYLVPVTSSRLLQVAVFRLQLELWLTASIGTMKPLPASFDVS